jgi:hypothetical protein
MIVSIVSLDYFSGAFVASRSLSSCHASVEPANPSGLVLTV